MDTLVTRSDEIAWGATVIVGTRVPVSTLFEYLESGKSLDDFIEQFPSVTRDTAVAILEAAKHRLMTEAATG